MFKPAAAPALDPSCHFPWYGVAGCKGKDPRAMLRLSVTNDLQNRARLEAAAGWYESVREDYGAK